MGNCQGTGDNSSPDMKNYLDLPIDASFEHPGYCDFLGTNYVNCGENGEFIAGGTGTGRCSCRGICGNTCTRKTCVRKNFSGTIDKCCQLGGPDYYMEGSQVKTCNPIYRQDVWANRKSCDDNLRDFCSRNYNAFDSPGCKRWFTLNRQNDKVDAVMKEVCRRPENINRRECACILATDRIEREIQDLPPNQRTIPPYCMAPECVTNLEAWKTSQQHSPCQTTYCGVNINKFQLTGQNPSVVIKQNCGNRGTDAGGVPIESGDIDPDPNAKDPIRDTFFQKYGVYIIGAIILLIVLGLIGFGAYSMN